jgi:hypothetical protein
VRASSDHRVQPYFTACLEVCPYSRCTRIKTFERRHYVVIIHSGSARWLHTLPIHPVGRTYEFSKNWSSNAYEYHFSLRQTTALISRPNGIFPGPCLQNGWGIDAVVVSQVLTDFLHGKTLQYVDRVLRSMQPMYVFCPLSRHC